MKKWLARKPLRSQTATPRDTFHSYAPGLVLNFLFAALGHGNKGDGGMMGVTRHRWRLVQRACDVAFGIRLIPILLLSTRVEVSILLESTSSMDTLVIQYAYSIIHSMHNIMHTTLEYAYELVE